MLGVVLGAALSLSAAEPRLVVIPIHSRILQNNPLHDPADRIAAVFLPAQATNGTRLPVVYYLPGFGGAAGNFTNHAPLWLQWVQRTADQTMPVVLAVVDARTRWGGSQYLNSPAQGNYADYLCREVVKQVEARFPVPRAGVRRIIAGHSSGGFGALRLGMAQHKLFDAVIALSPDSDFPTSHYPVTQAAAVKAASPTEMEQIENDDAPPPRGDLGYAVALCAAYAPVGTKAPGRFEWLYDAQGNFTPHVWQRWLDNDPLTLVRRNRRAFAARQRVYLEGAAQDEYAANVGARKIYETLRPTSIPCVFFEPPGHHADHVPERLARGVAWVFERPLPAMPK